MNSPILPILTLKLVATATSLDPSGKEVPNRHSTTNNLPYGENLVKIGQVDPEFSFLKVY